jgi:hypothetical protein
VEFFRHHRGQPFASSALMAPMTRAFVRSMESYCQRHDIPVITFRPGERKDDVAQAYLARCDGQEGILFAGKAQEKARVFRTEKRRNTACLPQVDPITKAGTRSVSTSRRPAPASQAPHHQPQRGGPRGVGSEANRHHLTVAEDNEGVQLHQMIAQESGFAVGPVCLDLHAWIGLEPKRGSSLIDGSFGSDPPGERRRGPRVAELELLPVRGSGPKLRTHSEVSADVVKGCATVRSTGRSQ